MFLWRKRWLWRRRSSVGLPAPRTCARAPRHSSRNAHRTFARPDPPIPERSVSDARARIAALSLRDFRNFERLEMEFPAEGLVLVGENGQGKTNLLEAAYYLSLLRSARGTRAVAVARFGSSGFYIDAKICAPPAEAHEISIGFERASRRKRVRRDGVVVERISDALGT